MPTGTERTPCRSKLRTATAVYFAAALYLAAVVHVAAAVGVRGGDSTVAPCVVEGGATSDAATESVDVEASAVAVVASLALRQVGASAICTDSIHNIIHTHRALTCSPYVQPLRAARENRPVCRS